MAARSPLETIWPAEVCQFKEEHNEARGAGEAGGASGGSPTGTGEACAVTSQHPAAAIESATIDPTAIDPTTINSPINPASINSFINPAAINSFINPAPSSGAERINPTAIKERPAASGGLAEGSAFTKPTDPTDIDEHRGSRTEPVSV